MFGIPDILLILAVVAVAFTLLFLTLGLCNASARPVSAMENSGLNSQGVHIVRVNILTGSWAAVATVTATEQSLLMSALVGLGSLPAQIPLRASVYATRMGTPQAGIVLAHTRIIDATHIGFTWVNPTAGPVTPGTDDYNLVFVW